MYCLFYVHNTEAGREVGWEMEQYFLKGIILVHQGTGVQKWMNYSQLFTFFLAQKHNI